MSSIEFPHRHILTELTDVVNQQGLDPYEAYGLLFQSQSDLGYTADSYLSTSITSGGHARKDGLAMREVIAKNTESARLLAEQLAKDRQIDPLGAIEPVFVGKTPWTQAEFMEFWLSVIGGFELTNGFVARDIDALRTRAHQAFDELELDLALMTSREDASVRAAEYFKMSSAFAHLVAEGHAANPISTLVRLIDTELSLGAQTERIFARQIGAKVMSVCVMQSVDPTKLREVNHQLAVDTAELISFGATVFDTRNNQVRLILSEDQAA